MTDNIIEYELINHKTGNSIQIMSNADAKKIAKMTQRRGYGTMLS